MSIARRLGWTLAVANVAFILVATLTPVQQALPHRFPSHCYFCGETGAVDVLLNLLLFMPLGFGLALLGRRWWVALLVCGGLTTFVESMQLFVIAGRDASVSDLVNNTGGGMIGFLLAARWAAVALPDPRRAARLAVAAAAGWVAITVATALALAPAVRGEVTLRLRSIGENFAYYRGAVFRGELAGVPLRATGPDSLFRTPPGLTVVIAPNGALTAWADVTAGVETEATAPVGGAFVGPSAHIMLGQDRRVLAYAVRLRAANVKLRHPGVEIADFFPGPDGRPGLVATGDTLRLWGAMVGDSLRVGAVREPGGASVAARTTILSPFLGWTMILFWNLYAGDALNAVLTALWVAALLVPCGYWSARARGVRWVRWVPPVAILAGVLGVPAAMHRTPAAWWVWAGAVAGVGGGALLACGAARVAARHGLGDARHAGTPTAAAV